MANISYLFKRICTMNYKSMFDRVDLVKTKCDKSKIEIFSDMVVVQDYLQESDKEPHLPLPLEEHNL